ncbi:LPS export ABC transporter periplasmic protein LptC [Hymenobacter sp. BT491]|uniref:LPS export ABC transporter periplasmic protein LptC n=1 Tax=Hymenobacter sp. BT491 TaxID=2766779 RepID=UPI00292A3D1E|nr:LPS export ABC transporter periplasmic protein LptC [Hymenobacter sp. BT491]
MKDTKPTSWSWLLAATLVAASLGLGCKDKATEVKKKIVYTGPTIETSNVVMLVSDSAKLQIKLTAPVQQQFESGDQIWPKNVMVTFYGQGDSASGNRKVVNTLRGNYGKYDKLKNLYIVRGDVRVHNLEKDQKMFTEEVFFDQQKAIIYTDSTTAVRVETPTETLTGNGLRANQDFSNYRIFHPTGVFTVQQPASDSVRAAKK